MRIFLLSIFVLLAGELAAQNFEITDTVRAGAYGRAVWGDFDGDGRMDLAYGSQNLVVGEADSMQLFRNTGSGFELVAQEFPYFPNPAMATADLNNDGKDELIYSGFFADHTYVYTSDGAGGFVDLTDIHLPAVATGYINAVDYNGDGFLDLFISGYDTLSQPLGALFKGGAGLTFTGVSTSISGFADGQSKWEDYDNDGKPDLITIGEGFSGNDVRVYKNMGADSFLLTATFPHGLETVDWIDYNEDGFADFVISGYNVTTALNETFLYKNNGAGGFVMAPLTNLPAFGEPSQVAVADFNVDGHPDIFFTGGNIIPLQKSVLALGTGTETFILDTTFLDVDQMNCIVQAADFNNDGRPDLFLNNFFVQNLGPAAIAGPSKEAAMLKVYPNPGKDQAVLQWQATEAQTALVTVTDAAGKVILKQTIRQKAGSNKMALDLQHAAAGLYFLRVSAGGSSKVGHWVKR